MTSTEDLQALTIELFPSLTRAQEIAEANLVSATKALVRVTKERDDAHGLVDKCDRANESLRATLKAARKELMETADELEFTVAQLRGFENGPADRIERIYIARKERHKMWEERDQALRELEHTRKALAFANKCIRGCMADLQIAQEDLQTLREETRV